MQEEASQQDNPGLGNAKTSTSSILDATSNRQESAGSQYVLRAAKPQQPLGVGDRPAAAAQPTGLIDLPAELKTRQVGIGGSVGNEEATGRCVQGRRLRSERVGAAKNKNNNSILGPDQAASAAVCQGEGSYPLRGSMASSTVQRRRVDVYDD
ncbi:hypothetical protein VTN96DRAFT_9751 [Rasamsonia emersonii]